MRLLAAPFGAVASVYAWHRFGAAVQRILARLFHVAYPRYVDDLFGLDAAGSEAATLTRVVISELLGWELDSEKEITDADTCVVLGVKV